MTKPVRTRDDLKGAIEHIGYEIAMCVACANRLQEPFTDTLSTFAILEAHLLHARALIEFFTGSGKRDDIRRAELVPSWHPAPSDAVRRLRAKLPDIQQQLSHITWHRVTNGNRMWDTAETARDVLAVARDWAAHLASTDAELADALRLAASRMGGLVL